MQIHAEPGKRRGLLRPALIVLAVLLFLQGSYKLASGTSKAWVDGRDIDLQLRATEYARFRAGHYPNHAVEPSPKGEPHLGTVYPPYAFPMMAPLFEPAGLVQGRIVLFVLTLASLVVIGASAFRVLEPFGTPLATVGALAAYAVSGNQPVFLLGQFSILCVALLFLQLRAIERGRPIAAGAFWALAMLKPHVALPFAALFLLRKQFGGLLVGLGILAALSMLALVWTDVSVGTIVHHWTKGLSFAFSDQGFSVNPGGVAQWLGVDHRVTQFIALGLLAVAAIPAALLLRRMGPDAALPLSALAAGAGFLLFYHRLYDQIMLFPVVLAMLVTAAASRRTVAIVIAVLMLASVLPPNRFIEGRVAIEAALGGLWALAAAYPMACLLVARWRRTPDVLGKQEKIEVVA